MDNKSVDILNDGLLVNTTNATDRFMVIRPGEEQPVKMIEQSKMFGAILGQKGQPNGIASLDSAAKVPIAQLPAGQPYGIAGLDKDGRVPLSQLPGIGGGSVYDFSYTTTGDTPEDFYRVNKQYIDAFAAEVLEEKSPTAFITQQILSISTRSPINYNLRILSSSGSVSINFYAQGVFSVQDGVVSWQHIAGTIQVGDIGDIPNSTSVIELTPNVETINIATTIDYTSLTEQAVPGMKYPNQNGVNDTVYYRTFRISGEVDADGNFYATLASNIGAKTVLYTIGALNWIDKSWANIPIPYAYFHSVGTLSSTIEASSVHITSSGAINLNIACPPAAAGFGLNVRVTVFYMKS